MRVDGQTFQIDEPPEIDRRRKHAVEVIIDRATIRPDARSRMADSVESALSLGAACCTSLIRSRTFPSPAGAPRFSASTLPATDAAEASSN